MACFGCTPTLRGMTSRGLELNWAGSQRYPTTCVRPTRIGTVAPASLQVGSALAAYRPPTFGQRWGPPWSWARRWPHGASRPTLLVVAGRHEEDLGRAERSQQPLGRRSPSRAAPARHTGRRPPRVASKRQRPRNRVQAMRRRVQGGRSVDGVGQGVWPEVPSFGTSPGAQGRWSVPRGALARPSVAALARHLSAARARARRRSRAARASLAGAPLGRRSGGAPRGQGGAGARPG